MTNPKSNASQPAGNTMDHAENRILVKFKTPQAIDANNRFTSPPVSNTMYGIGIEKIEALNPAPSQLLSDTLLLGNRSSQNKWAAITISESGPDAVSSALQKFKDSGDYDAVEKDYVIRIGSTNSGKPPQMCGGCLYGMRKIDAPRAWEITQGDRDIVVGIIDSGINIEHPSIKPNMWINDNIGAAGYPNDKYGFDFVENVGIDDGYLNNDILGHGTHVAGIVGAAYTDNFSVCGVAPNVRMAAIRVIGDDYSFMSIAAKGVNYANNMGIPITNNSYGCEERSRLLYDVIAEAGLFVTVSMNDGHDMKDYPQYPGCFELDNIINVAATDYYDELAQFSGYGDKLVHLAAPGVNICSTYVKLDYGRRQYGFFQDDGTSMACPHVAGAAALVLSVLKGVNIAKMGGTNAADRRWIQELRNRLLNNVDLIPSLQGKVSTGGRLNVYSAITSSR